MFVSLDYVHLSQSIVTSILDEALGLHVNTMRASQLQDATSSYKMSP